jgi:DNA-binding transcriptional MerR regulator
MFDAPYAIGELADLGGISRRTVRYYVQEGLLPPPRGLGRGNHYGREHLDRLLQLKALQEAGRSLDEIRQLLGQREAPASTPSTAPPLARTAWRRIEVAPGVELHVRDDVRLPPPGRLQELASWCRQHFGDADSSSRTGDA